MKRTTKYGITGVLFLLFVLLTVDEALARPQWLKCSFTPSIVVTGKDRTASDYYSLKIVVEHFNKSKDKIVTAIYNKELIFTALFNENLSLPSKAVIKSTKVNKMELYPEQGIKVAYYIRLDQIRLPQYAEFRDWENFNEKIGDIGLNKINKIKKTQNGSIFPYFAVVFDKRQYSYDCKVKTK